jgi:GntR family transcriptional regulator/MocR family aminotransferase
LFAEQEALAMAGRRSAAPLIALALDRAAAPAGSGAGALHRQIYDQVRELVLDGRLAPGTRLPSTRALARDLGCSRNTAVLAFEQLLSEGYLEGRRGSGTYVSRVLPEDLLSVRGRAPGAAAVRKPDLGGDGAKRTARRARLSERGRRLAELRRGQRTGVSERGSRAFTPGIPELGSFPFEVWGRLLGRAWRRPSAALTRHGEPAGYPPLRAAIARYLGGVRALRCDWTQVVITSGAQHGLDLAARLLLDPDDRVWIEEPGYTGLRGPLMAAGARLVPLPVDAAGLSVARGRARAPDARLAVVTPSHQYPLGVTMSLARRLELLDWARAAGAWIIEDDYDSEFRYAGRPLAALQSLDADPRGGYQRGGQRGGQRVIYVGTFSKVLFPSLRLGYLVVPPDLVEPFGRARAALDDHPSSVTQPALAAFIEEGHFAAHVRRMRLLYAARRACLLAAAERHLGALLEVEPDEAGLHVVALLAPELAARMDDRAAEARAAAAGLTAPALSSFYLGAPGAGACRDGAGHDGAGHGAPCGQGLLLGYAAVAEPEIEAGIEALARALA